MKIWIHINDVQEGPFTPDTLPLNRMDPQTPVWYEGLDYWMPASAAPVTAELLRSYYAGNIKPGHSQGQESSPQDNTVDVESPATTETEIDVETHRTAQTSGTYSAGRQHAAYSAAQTTGHASDSKPGKCPPTYLVWSIILTLLCCNPIGIVAAVMGWTVTTKYREYDYEGAARRSETTAWWFIITIVTSLIFTPMYMLVSM